MLSGRESNVGQEFFSKWVIESVVMLISFSPINMA